MRLALLFALLGLAGCQIPSEAGFSRTMDKSIGKPEISVIRTLGPPDRVYQTGGSRFLFYRQQNISGNSYGIATYTCDMTFEMVNGIVKSWDAKGNACRY